MGRWPGGCNGKEAFRLQAASGDAIGSVPLTRWVLEEAVDVTMLSAAQASCASRRLCRRRAFDSTIFTISIAEAGAMDPQQRLLLELGYAALHGSIYRRATLMGGDGGVFLGIERPDWALTQPPSARGSVYVVTGDNVSVVAGRMSFALGMQGPCSSVDTACCRRCRRCTWVRMQLRRRERLRGRHAVSLKLAPCHSWNVICWHAIE